MGSGKTTVGEILANKLNCDFIDIDVLIEEKIVERNMYLGRSFHFAPEVDGVFLVKSKRILKPGDLIKAKVTRADDYDLHGVDISCRT